MCYEWCTVNFISLFLLKGTCQSCGVGGPNLWACLQVRSLFPSKHVRQVECIFRHNYYSLCPAFPTVWLSLCRLRRISFWSQYYTCTGIHSVIHSILWHSFCSVIIHISFSCSFVRVCIFFLFFQAKKHNLTVNLTTFRVWCYVCEREVFLEPKPVTPVLLVHRCKPHEQVKSSDYLKHLTEMCTF